MNYHVESKDGSFWYATNGLRSLFNHCKYSDTSFRKVCSELLKTGQIQIVDNRFEDDYFLITMI